MRSIKAFGLLALTLAVASCGVFGGNKSQATGYNDALIGGNPREVESNDANRTTIWDAFGPNENEQKVQVNRYLWAASLDVLNFLPIQTVDPFTGIIVTGYGTPPGGGRSYRATVHVRDPALDARSLSVALQGSGGSPVSIDTTRAVEDAILSRARQMRIQDSKF
jgi:hypothetical protein